MNRYICRVCGYVHEGELDETTICPVCHLGAEFFKLETKPERDEHVFVDIDESNMAICRNPDKCVRCGNCKSVCRYKQAVYGRYNAQKCKGKSVCVDCGQCSIACPAEAIEYKNDYLQLKNEMKDKSKVFVFITAPATRVSLAEVFGQPEGTICTQHVVGALRSLGADYVFDATFGADLTIMEEANEFIQRLTQGGTLPMITSCSPGWVKYIEMNYPELLPHLSSCKSPHEMFGAILKSYYASKAGIDPSKMFVVSVMPCIAKKFERQREEMKNEELDNVDAVLTTRELARMIKQANIDFVELSDSEFDDPMGEATGAGAIFGTTGGVMEAALRTAFETITGEEIKKLDFDAVRGEEEIKKATIKIGDKDVKVAVAHGLANAQKIMEEIKSGKADYQFVEVMACPGGCVMGGGQPIKTSKQRSEYDIRKLRADCLYTIDEKSTIRKSHENPTIKKLYKEFLEKPGSHKAHELLHTTYHKRNKYNI